MMPVQNELYQQQQQPMSLPPMTNTNSQIDQEFTQINQQIQGLSLQYQSQTYEYGNVGVETTQSQPAEVNSYDSQNQYAQPNLYEPQPQTDFYGHSNQSIEANANNATGYPEQQPLLQQQQQPQSPQQQPTQMYQQQTYNDPLAYNAPNSPTYEYGNAAEVNFCTFSNIDFPIFIYCIQFWNFLIFN